MSNDTALVKVPGSVPVRVSPVGLVVTGEISFDGWASIGPVLGEYSRAVAWAIGDWLNLGEARWGEMYGQALDTTGLSLGRLRNLKYLSGAVPYNNRVARLSLSHHEAVAPYPIDQQNRLLLMAVEHGFTRDEMREVIKEIEAGIQVDEIEEQLVIESGVADDETVAAKARQVAKAFSKTYTGLWPGSSILWEELTELCDLIGEKWHG
jgi:hypothetical protein